MGCYRSWSTWLQNLRIGLLRGKMWAEPVTNPWAPRDSLVFHGEKPCLLDGFSWQLPTGAKLQLPQETQPCFLLLCTGCHFPYSAVLNALHPASWLGPPSSLSPTPDKKFNGSHAPTQDQKLYKCVCRMSCVCGCLGSFNPSLLLTHSARKTAIHS